MSEETQSVQSNAELAAAWNTVLPLEDVRVGSAFEVGAYDWAIQSLTPGLDKNGKVVIVGEFKALAPADIALLPGKGGVFSRTLYFGTQKDPKFTLPETALNCASLRFLKSIAVALKLPAGNQSLNALCAALVGKTFSCRLDHGKDYDAPDPQNPGKTIKKQGGLEFGRTVTPVGTIPAKLDRVAAQATATPTATAAPVGATFN